MNIKPQKMFPITIGEEGIDDFFLKYGSGEIVPWPTDKELELWEEQLRNEQQDYSI